MALKATVFKADLQVANLDQNQFGDYSLTLAQHPSETIERVMIRLLAFALYASEDLRFGRGLSNEEDAAVWEIDPSGVTRLWIDVGLPDEARVKKACSRADRAVIITYGGRPSDMWWQQNANALTRYKNLSVIQLSPEDSAKLVEAAGRTMKLSWTIQEGMVYLDNASITPIVLSAQA
ncbi:YaeQ family protein [Fluviibacter phosphoraccumulans]|uniref:YaeQ family protein n=1 Tax=Fluviibacter phosphoraccumulans TaxID=1751046 RepID=UPI0024E19F3A|nr:YaeQ family protein [Fluviibacter phosphoraccumulans]